MENTYNGWTNRETWLTNMYYNEVFVEYSKDLIEEAEGDLDVSDLSDSLYAYFEGIIEDESDLSPFLKDYIDFGLINFYEIAEVMHDDLVEWYSKEA